MTAQLKQIFPDAQLKLSNLREHLVVAGQARSIAQTTRIMETMQAYTGHLREMMEDVLDRFDPPEAAADRSRLP